MTDLDFREKALRLLDDTRRAVREGRTESAMGHINRTEDLVVDYIYERQEAIRNLLSGSATEEQ